MEIKATALKNLKFNLDKNERIEGRFIFGDIVYNFTAYRTVIGMSSYPVRGTVSMLDGTGHVLCVGGKRAAKQLYCKSTSTDKVKLAMANCADNLLRKFGGEQQFQAKKFKPVSQMSFGELVTHYGEDFFFRKNSKQRHEGLRKLNKTAKLIGKPLGQITVSDIKKAFKDEKRARDYISTASRFLREGVPQQGSSSVPNPFEEFLHQNISRKSTAKMQDDASKSSVITVKEQYYMDKYIGDNIFVDGLCPGLLLIYGAGLPVPDACKVKLCDIKKDESLDMVFINYQNRDSTSSVQDYTFPVAKFYGDLIMQVVKNAKTADPDHYKEQYAVTIGGKKEIVDSKKLTDYCRSVVGHIRDQYDQEMGHMVPSHKDGVTILRMTYKDRLRTQCGITDRATLNFLCHESVGHSVLASNYRSFTSETGRAYLAMMLQRDRRHTKEPRKLKNKTVKCDDGYKTTLYPLSAKEHTVHYLDYQCTGEEELKISCKYGAVVSIRVVED